MMFGALSARAMEPSRLDTSRRKAGPMNVSD
jgi:hypothetical protein